MHELLGPRPTERSRTELLLLRSMFQDRRARFVPSGLPSLGHTLEAATDSWEIVARSVLKNGGFPADIIPEVSAIMGGPGVGKSRKVKRYILPFFNAFADRIERTYDFRPTIVHVSCDTDLRNLIKYGFIVPRANGSLSPGDIHFGTAITKSHIADVLGGERERLLYHLHKELSRYDIPPQIIDHAFARVTAGTNGLRSGFDPLILVAEALAGTSGILHDKRNTRWAPPTRQYNNRLAHSLLYREDEFVDVPEYRLGARVGVIGGINMDVYGQKYRGLLQTMKTLDEVNHLNELLGLPPFNTTEDWEQAREGATPASVRLAHRKMAATARFTLEKSTNEVNVVFLSEMKRFPELEDPGYGRNVEHAASILGIPKNLMAWRQRQRYGEANVLANLLCLDDPNSPPTGTVIENNPPLNIPPGSEDKLKELFDTIYA